MPVPLLLATGYKAYKTYKTAEKIALAIVIIVCLILLIVGVSLLFNPEKRASGFWVTGASVGLAYWIYWLTTYDVNKTRGGYKLGGNIEDSIEFNDLFNQYPDPDTWNDQKSD